MSGLAAAIVATLVVLMAGGWPFRGATSARGWAALPGAYAAGAVSLHLALAVATLAGFAWTPELIVAAALLTGAGWAARGGFRRDPMGGPPVGPASWALLVLAGLLVAVAAAGWLTQPDFYYHWGLKAARFLEIRGVDYLFFQGPSAWRLHPDYPLLAPQLLMLPSVTAGRFDEAAALATGGLWCVLVGLALRRALAAGGLGRARLDAACVVLALGLAAFVVAFGLVGAADPLMALALLLALPPLLAREASPERAWELGLAAALAATSKLEGLPLALLLIAAGALRWSAGPWRWPGVATCARLVLPAALASAPGWGLAQVYGLFVATNTGAFEAGRSGAIWEGIFATALHPDWALLPLVLLALPWLARSRQLVAAAAVVAAQLVVYLFVYYTGPVDTRFYVLASFPRLLFHLVPAALALAALRLDGILGRDSFGRESPTA